MKIYSHLFPFIIALALSTIIVNATQSVMPRVEGSIFPVATATHVRLDVITDQRTMVQGTMDKRRDCPVTGLRVYQVAPGTGSIVAIVDVETTIRRRDAGEQEFGPWEVAMPMWVAEGSMRAVTTHQCHPFWPTETVLFDTSIKTCTVECREP